MKFINSMNDDECIFVFYTFNFREFLNICLNVLMNFLERPVPERDVDYVDVNFM
jgi:hypothetical protein